MNFKFLKYISPINYVNLIRKDGTTIFPSMENIPIGVKEQLDFDENYKSIISSELDASWQAIQKGYIGNTATIAFEYELPIIDEYRFVRKYHKSFWATYCLLLRLLTFKKPLKELKAYYQTKSVKQVKIFESPIEYKSWSTFQSSLLEKKPKVVVIIPTLNRYSYLKDGLKDLEQQDYDNFEVMVMDQSEPFQQSFYDQFNLQLEVTYQKEKALWLARNTAIENSDAEYLLLFDDDSLVKPDWISNHIKGLDYFKADISSGQSISKSKEELPINYQYFRISDLLDTGNVLIKRAVFKQIGLFDRQFEKQRMGDGEFGLRAFLNGFLNISNPYATRLHLKVETGGLRDMGSWDAFRSKKWLAPKPIPSVLYLYRKYYGTKLTLFELLKSVPPSSIPYRFKKNKKMLILGMFISIVLFPLAIYQVLRSWQLASVKLKQGTLIEEL